MNLSLPWHNLARGADQGSCLIAGTPLQNGVGELFQLLCFLEPIKFGSMDRLEAEYANLAEHNKVCEPLTAGSVRC